MTLNEIFRRLRISTPPPKGKYSMESSLSRLMQKVERVDKEQKAVRTMLLYKRLAVAAAVGLLFAAGGLTYLLADRPAEQEMAEVVNVSGQVKHLKLSDGSRVSMNVGSKLIYSKKFSKDKREVFLSGEACFEVSKEKQRPFIVRLGDIAVRVLGTHFNVKAYPGEETITATLLEGSVQIDNKVQNRTLLLVPNDAFTYNQVSGRGEIIRLANAKENISWLSGKIVMDKMSMEEVCKRLERVYNVRIIIMDETLKQKQLTGVLNYSEKLTDLLEILRISTPFTTIVNDKTYIIK